MSEEPFVESDEGQRRPPAPGATGKPEAEQKPHGKQDEKRGERRRPTPQHALVRVRPVPKQSQTNKSDTERPTQSHLSQSPHHTTF